ncbi:hypothetical protein F2Q69_00005927 [Brassica cretica]|uniref:Uncharacterized protein n=1 Tax=Brassica cretica TaxID=69181 RepID=A0A8S9NXI6_BRACR|nr:hypothetical protein F2Q69_00005927 [Brassica cretica]
MLGMFCGGLVFPPSHSGFKEIPYPLDREDSDRRGHGLWLSITRRGNVTVTRRTVGCRAVTRRTVGPRSVESSFFWPLWFPLLEAISWQEAKSNLVTVAGRGRQLTESWSKFCDSDQIVPNPSRSASGPWCWVGQDEKLKVEGVRGQTQTRTERRETDSENWVVVWTGQMAGNKTSWERTSSVFWEKGDREGFKESGQVRIMGSQSVMAEQQ